MDKNLDSHKPQKTDGLYYFIGFRMDADELRLWHGEDLVPLTPKEFEVLYYLVKHAGQVADKNDLLDAIWEDRFIEEATLARNVSWLRQKLAVFAPKERLIETIPKRGYRFNAEVNRADKNDDLLIVEEHTIQQICFEATITHPVEHSVQPIASHQNQSFFNNKYLKFAVFASGFILIALTGFFTIYQTQTVSREIKAVVVKRIFSLSGALGDEDDPKFSPDGKKIVYSYKAVEANTRNIHIRQINVGDSFQLTDSDADDRYPTYSPDGLHVAFLREYKDYGELITIPSLGGREKVICRLFSGNYSISFSPDGEDIAVIDTENSEVEGQYAVYLVNRQTFERRRLTAPGEFDGETTPRFSPDGKYVAFVRLKDHKQDIFVVPSSGGEPRQLTFDGATINSLSWSPNGEVIYFVSYRGGKKDKERMWRIPVAGGEPELISIGMGNLVNMAVSPNGNMLAVSVTRDKSSIYLVKPDGKHAQKFIFSNGSDSVDNFSPDGSRILFRSNRMRDVDTWKAFDLWTANKEGKDLRRITDSMDTLAEPAFSPDGSTIKFRGQRNGKFGTFIVSAKGGKIREIESKYFGAHDISWSADGKWFYTSIEEDGQHQIAKIRSDGSGEAIQITRNGGYYPQASPDGNLIYYQKSKNAGGLCRVHVNGGNEEEIKEISEAGFQNFLDRKLDNTPDHWKVTDKGIYFLIINQDKSYEIKFFDFATKNVNVVIERNQIPQNITNHFVTDGDNFLFTVKERISNIMLIDLSE